MKITKKLQGWLVANKGVSADASEDEFKTAAANALVDGSLSGDQYAELTKDADADTANSFEKKLDAMLAALTKTSERIDAIEKTPVAPPQEETKDFSDAKVSEKAQPIHDVSKVSGESEKTPSGTSVNVIEAHTRYSTTKSAATYPEVSNRGVKHSMAGQRVYEGGGKAPTRYIDEPSERDKAISGAWLKWRFTRELGDHCPNKLRMTQHDKDLLRYGIKEGKWAGVWNGTGTEQDGAVAVKNERLAPHMQNAMISSGLKAVGDGDPVLDEVGGSGGQEVVPSAFDDDVILIPLLFGEVFPRVNLVPIARGSRVEGASFQHVDVNSNQAEGSEMSLFDPTTPSAFIAEFNTTIFVAAGGIVVGLDFLEDSPVDVSNIITQSYGQQLMVWLDEQICIGDGTTEPDGVLNATGVTTITEAAALSVGDYESLLFTVAKPYRQGVANNRIAYVTRESVYQAARGIAVSGTDQRRVFGMETNFHESYRILGYDNAINEAMGADDALFGNFARYRMYRRLGMSLGMTTAGEVLTRRNELLVTMRARFGGQVEDGNAFSQATALIV